MIELRTDNKIYMQFKNQSIISIQNFEEKKTKLTEIIWKYPHNFKNSEKSKITRIN